MLVNKQITSLLKNTVSVAVYADYVPEDLVPGIAFNSIGYTNTRNLEGNASGNRSFHRVQVVTNTDEEMENIVNELLTLDNTNNDDFQKIYIELSSLEPISMSTPYIRCFLNLNVYNR